MTARSILRAVPGIHCSGLACRWRRIPHDNPSILLADDDRAIRLVAGRALEKAGYHVHAEESIAGMEAALEDPGISVLITDVAFPDGDALERLPSIRSKRPDLIIILMSARSTLLTAVKAQERGVYSYLPKPFPLHDLVSAAAGAFKLADSQADPGIVRLLSLPILTSHR